MNHAPLQPFRPVARQLRWVAVDQTHQVAWSILVLTVPLQVLAAVLGSLGRDPVAGTGSALLAGGWAATAVATLTTAPGSSSGGLGIVLVAVGAALVVPTVAGRSKLAAACGCCCLACGSPPTGSTS